MPVRVSRSLFHIISRGLCSNAAVRVERPVWHLHGAVCVQRVPIISTEFTPEQKELQTYLCDVQQQQSILSDFELLQEEDRRIEELKKSEDYDASAVDPNRISSYELEKEWQERVAHVTLASRLTADDKANNVKSTDRLLHRPLTLLVQKRFDDMTSWAFPETAHREGESMRQTGERALLEQCGLQARFLGNAPIGYYKYKYPVAVREKVGAEGAKVFVFKAQLLDRDVTVTLSDEIMDYMWLPSDAITDHVITNPHILARSHQCLLEL